MADPKHCLFCNLPADPRFAFMFGAAFIGSLPPGENAFDAMTAHSCTEHAGRISETAGTAADLCLGILQRLPPT